jgi:hypothetical protein
MNLENLQMIRFISDPFNTDIIGLGSTFLFFLSENFVCLFMFDLQIQNSYEKPC